MKSIFCLILTLSAAIARANVLEQLGDIFQYTNPGIVYYIADNEKGSGHFLMHYGQSMGIMALGKWSGNEVKYNLAKRPDGTSYKGMPSGHTTSAWSSAAYMRKYSNKHHLTIPLYATAIITGYSRVHAKKHTLLQVLVAAVLSEAVVEINSRFKWTKDHIEFSGNSIQFVMRV